MTSPRALAAIGAVLIVVGTLFTLATPTMAPGPALSALAALGLGLVALLTGVIRMATTTTLIVAGAFLQLGGALLLITGQPRVPPGFVAVAMALSASGFLLLLTGVIAAGVKLALRERDDAPRAETGR